MYTLTNVKKEPSIHSPKTEIKPCFIHFFEGLLQSRDKPFPPQRSATNFWLSWPDQIVEASFHKPRVGFRV